MEISVPVRHNEIVKTDFKGCEAPVHGGVYPGQLWLTISNRLAISVADELYRSNGYSSGTCAKEQQFRIDSQRQRIRNLEHDLANERQVAMLANAELENAIKDYCHCGERVREHTCPEAVSKLMNHHLRELRDLGKWMPINTAPKDETCILVSDGLGVYQVQWARMCEGWYMIHGDKRIEGPTQWMPLPMPPL